MRVKSVECAVRADAGHLYIININTNSLQLLSFARAFSLRTKTYFSLPHHGYTVFSSQKLVGAHKFAKIWNRDVRAVQYCTTVPRKKPHRPHIRLKALSPYDAMMHASHLNSNDMDSKSMISPLNSELKDIYLLPPLRDSSSSSNNSPHLIAICNSER